MDEVIAPTGVGYSRDRFGDRMIPGLKISKSRVDEIVSLGQGYFTADRTEAREEVLLPDGSTYELEITIVGHDSKGIVLIGDLLSLGEEVGFISTGIARLQHQPSDDYYTFNFYYDTILELGVYLYELKN